jgi:hypothetical protein
MKINYLFIALVILFAGCEQIITLDLPDVEEQIIVEGSIETGLPPIVILTRSIGFYGATDLEALQNLYVRDATVTVSNGETSVELLEICLNDIPEELQPLVAEFFGISADSLATFDFNICVYTDPGLLLGAPIMLGEDGKTYNLTIEAEGKVLTSTTTIPPAVPLDSVFYRPNDDPGGSDTLVRVFAHLSDPPAPGNYYRLFVSRNNGPFEADFFSVTDDLVFNGLSLDFTINRPAEPDEDFSSETFGYYFVGDTVAVKLCSIDQASFNFWNTLENDSGGDGPFSSIVIVETNIEGGQGIWCGYGASTTTLIIE